MSTQALTKTNDRTPAFLGDFFSPLNEWFDNSTNFWNRTLCTPAVNIMENKDEYSISLAVPGMKKDDFKINIDGNMLSISCQKDETREEKDKKFTRKEYSYTSFSRSFTLPDEVKKEMIDASYEDGLLKISLPRKEEVKKPAAKQIAVK
jgi:HSP20 family protein